MNLYDAIYQGIQTNQISSEAISWNTIEEILHYADQLEGLISNTAVEFKLIDNTQPNDKYNSFFSFNAPYYLLIAAEETKDYLINVGYLMEQMRLYINTKGLGTHFVYFRAPKHSITSCMKYNYVMTLAFGKPDACVYHKLTSEMKRLPEEFSAVYKEKVSLSMKKIVNAALMTPSIMNSQPWRLVVYQNRIHVFSKKNVFLNHVLNKNKQIDMGMMLANLFVSAEEQWMEPTLKFSELLHSQQRKSTDYLTTVLLQQNI